MSSIIEDYIPTYSEDGGNFKITSDITAVSGTLTRVTADEPIKFVSDDGVIIPSRTETERDAIADPQNGAVIYNSTYDCIDYYFNSKWNAFDPVFGVMYLAGNATATSGTGVNKIAGTYAAPAFLNRFSHAGGTLTYTGVRQLTCIIDVTISCILNTDNFEVFEFTVRVNGVEQTQKGCTTTSNIDDPSNVTFQVPIQLSTNDTIEVFGEHTSGGSDFTVQDMQVSIRQ